MFYSVPVTLQLSVAIDRTIVCDREVTVGRVLLTERQEDVLLRVRRAEARRAAGHGPGITAQGQAADQSTAAHQEVIRETEPADQEVDREERRGVMPKEAEQEAGRVRQETGSFI